MGGFLSRHDKRIRDWMDSDDEAPSAYSPTKRQKRGSSHGPLALAWGVAEWVGRKRTQEDRCIGCVLSDGATFAGVYDGHAGSKAAAYAASNLHTHVAGTGALRRRLLEAFHKTERGIITSGIKDGTTACVAVVEGTNFASKDASRPPFSICVLE